MYRIAKWREKNRWNGAFLCVVLFFAVIFGVCVYAVEKQNNGTVSFVDFDMEKMGDAYPSGSVPNGATLYSKDEILSLLPGETVKEGCSWYLYQAAEGDRPAYGPVAIPDPPARIGYEFYDWASQQGTASTLHTVEGKTTFMARYARSGQYLVNLYYQYGDEAGSVAAPTASLACGLGDSISMELPTLDVLEDLTPEISLLYDDQSAPGMTEAMQAVEELNTMLQKGVFTGKLDEEFLKLCRDAWFVEWDTETNNYKTDEHGVVQINIPVVYAFDGTAEFQVHYYLQGADDPRSYEPVEEDFVTAQTSDSTHVNLEELGLVNKYEGFVLNPVSQQYAASYTVNPDGTTVIDLHYDREVYYVTYALHGGNVQEPVAFRYGQTLPTGESAASNLLAAPVRSGYTFAGWTYRNGDGTELQQLPGTMPAHDLVLEANWTPATTTVTITYWLENANDEDYTPVGNRKIEVQTESIVEYDTISSYLDTAGMEGAGIDDGEYFTLVNSGDKAIKPVSAAGDRSTTINAYYDRKEYTLVFHVGWISDGLNGAPTSGYYCVSDQGPSQAGAAVDDWVSGYHWIAGAKNVTLTMGGKTYRISNETEDCYQITAKYGAFISELWPVASDSNVTAMNGYKLFTWGTHSKSDYYKNHNNKYIMGTYATMSAELILDPNNPDVPHHLTAYWSNVSSTAPTDQTSSFKVHHYMFEAVPGAAEEGASLTKGEQYKGYSAVSASQKDQIKEIESIQFYEQQKLTVRTTNTSAGQNPPAFANLTFRYGCYQGADVYFFYTYEDYTLTYDENNANLTTGGKEIHQQVNFHYVGGKPLKETLAEPGFAYDYQPEQPYICQYGNEHLFAGWYKDPECTIPIDWETASSDCSVTAYGKWEAPQYDLTLEVPEGSLPQTVLDSIGAKGYTVTSSSDPEGHSTTYVIHQVVDGTPINQVLGITEVPDNRFGLKFQYWYETDEDGEASRFLFDDSQVMASHRTLTAQWVEEDSGVYVVQSLTTDNPNNGLGTVTLDGKVYYRLCADETVKKMAIGSVVTLEPRPMGGYLPIHGSLTQVIEGKENNPTVFAFVYEPIANQTVKYTVHYVLDTGEDYGRAEAEDAIHLANSTTFVLAPGAARARQSSGQITGVALARAAVIPGYVPKEGYMAQMTLSSREDENNLYIYYISNADAGAEWGEEGAPSIQCAVKYFVWDEEKLEYPLQPEYTETISNVSEGTVLYAEFYADQYLASHENSGLALDVTLTKPSLIVSQANQDHNNTLAVYLKAPAQGGEGPDTDWSNPTPALPEPDEDYVPVPPPGPVPEGGEDGGATNPDEGTGDPDSGDATGDRTLHYDSHGGTLYENERYPVHTVVALDKVPVRVGYTFTGWYADEGLTKKITSITMNSDKTVYAGWRKTAVPDELNGEDHYAYIVGYSDGTVRPENNITRAEVAAIFFRLLQPSIRDSVLSAPNPFADIPADAWFATEVSALNALGIIQGRTETLFDGDAAITRAEFAAVCARFDTGVTNGNNSFSDIEGHWAEEEIMRAASLGWITGYEDGTYRPDAPITRAEAVSIINRVLNRMPEYESDLLPDMTTWPDNLLGNWYYLAMQEATHSHLYTSKGEMYEKWDKLTENPDWSQY